MGARGVGVVERSIAVVTAVVLGVVSGITVVAAPPAITGVVVLASEVAGTFYAGVLVGTLLGLFLAGFTAFLTYRVYRLQEVTTGEVKNDIGPGFAPTAAPEVTYAAVNDGDPPWFDVYLVGVVVALVTAVLAPVAYAPLVGGVVGALASARLFGGL
ncbi:hypothetical protein G9C85_17665 [Halorubellus sp. JP-L1]|uniref:hypothetical protein n=1 Tax=Halorubellus sp. JP-L1 TaxID=2715753 RepID=UPI00140B33E0|nr:hypothetical protein [Halorubellus sp. JP-L1]NHN43448.1 hypothetical protein [Halorubellus sp. JP-L1]